MEITIGQAWQRALMQFIDVQSPFGQAKVMCTGLLLLLTVMVGIRGARGAGGARAGTHSTLETWLACGLSILIGMNTIDAMQFTLGELLTKVTGRALGGTGALDIAIGSGVFMTCLVVWGLSGLAIMVLARGLGRLLGGLGSRSPAS